MFFFLTFIYFLYNLYTFFFLLHSNPWVANTNNMKSLRLKYCAFALLATFFWGGCHSKPNAPNSINPPISQEGSIDNQPLEQDSFENDTTLNPPSAPVLDPDVWDLSDIDVSEIDSNRKLISFTFDDAPSRLLENLYVIFASFNEANPDCKASATLFFNGYLFDKDTPHLLHAAKTLGFELGNHTQSHHDLTTLSEEELAVEIDATDALLKYADGKERHLLRPPYGSFNESVKQQAKTPIISWNVDTLDWTGRTADEIYQTVYDQRQSGTIVLMHDGYQATLDALKRLLPDLKQDGYQVVSVSQMAKMHGCTLRRGNVYIRARKQ